MVTFMCDGCQATLKKNKVDGHFSRGRCASASVSCVDCGVTFWGDDYAAHTSCISEAEKYQGRLYKGNKKTATKRAPPAPPSTAAPPCKKSKPEPSKSDRTKGASQIAARSRGEYSDDAEGTVRRVLAGGSPVSLKKVRKAVRATKDGTKGLLKLLIKLGVKVSLPKGSSSG